MSFKWKISAMITATVALILIATHIFVYYKIKSVTEERVQIYLLEKGKRLIDRIEANPGALGKEVDEWAEELEIDQAYQIINTNGIVLFETRSVIGQELIGEATSGICAETEVYYPGSTGLTIRLFDRADRELEFLKDLRLWLLAGSAFGTLLASVLSYFISRAAIHPVRKTIHRLKRIDIQQLDQRLEEPQARDEIYHLTQAFNHLLGRLEQGVKQLKQFVADASHELRTPTSIIEGHANLIKRWAKESPEIMEESLGYITQETVRIKTVTDQLIQLALLEQNEPIFRFESPEVNAIVRTIQLRLVPLHRHVDIQVHELQAPVFAHIPQEYFQQVLLNVLNNAIKYTPEGGNIHIHVSKASDQAIVRVKDTGIGIPPEELSRIFDRFYRVDKSRNRAHGGSGLGLAITKKMLEAFGGTISVESQPRRGSVFEIRVPLLSNVK
ncbi:ATP-binding protein [Cohnella faecalis]|uniref:histidine kinase n=1 Tax=Cohnella faecalis TaxID=2315694 RepID=A0A398CT38_9BACL|nr:ATP-binding protein [Cohnella faecalis]RIE02481.1 HAMP domain-containing protein [Cohnella faecalis]